jgi:hypothetical protein
MSTPEELEKNEEECRYLYQPKLINIPLFVHQLKGIDDMVKLEKSKEIIVSSSKYIKTRVGTFSDLPGYGKGLTVLGMIADTVNNECSEEFLLEKVRKYS